MLNLNPFIWGPPIDGINKFFGRKNELLTIQNMLYQKKGCLSIIGERRIGKTSLLNSVTFPEIINAYDLDEQIVFCHIAFQGFESSTVERIWMHILDRLSKMFPEDLNEELKTFFEKNIIDTMSLLSLFEKLQVIKIVFLFDEFEALLENPQISQDFYGCLRNISQAQNCCVSYIIVTHKPLAFYFKDVDSPVSQFFNSFQTLILHPLEISECNDLIEENLKDREVRFYETDKNKLINISGGYPYFFQMACYYLYNAYQNEQKDIWGYVEEEFRLQSKAHFEYFWKKSEENQKILLALFSLLTEQRDNVLDIPEEKLRKIYPRYDCELPDLYEDRSLILKTNDGYRLFSPIFSKWILTELTDTSQSNTQSFQEWLTTYQKNALLKGLNKIELAFKKVNPKYWELFNKTLLLVRDPQPILDLIELIF